VQHDDRRAGAQGKMAGSFAAQIRLVRYLVLRVQCNLLSAGIAVESMDRALPNDFTGTSILFHLFQARPWQGFQPRGRMVFRS
jgi:hypothetical protein